MDNAKTNAFILSDSITLVVPDGAYEGGGIFFASTVGGSIYLEGEPAALRRLRDRLNQALGEPCD